MAALAAELKARRAELKAVEDRLAAAKVETKSVLVEHDRVVGSFHWLEKRIRGVAGASQRGLDAGCPSQERRPCKETYAFSCAAVDPSGNAHCQWHDPVNQPRRGRSALPLAERALARTATDQRAGSRRAEL
jgi:hypothetical protein